jgi:hypothetical protein
MRRIALALVLAGCGGAPMAFSNVRVEAIGAERAEVLFDTSRATACDVVFGEKADAMDKTATDPAMAPGSMSMIHKVPLEGLKPKTTYFYRARAGGLMAPVAQFTTLEGSNVGGVNVALESKGTSVAGVSSNYGGGDPHSSFGAYKAIDGDLATEWSSNGDGDAAWLELDLGQVRSLTKLGFRSRSMLDGSSIIQKLRLVFDGGASTQGPFDTPDPNVRYVIDLAPVQARKVRVEAVKTSGGNSGAREIELY